MEWQLSGSDEEPAHIKDPKPTEIEEIERELERDDVEKGGEVTAESVEVPSTPSSRTK
jgi:hypothetical protein